MIYKYDKGGKSIKRIENLGVKAEEAVNKGTSVLNRSKLNINNFVEKIGGGARLAVKARNSGKTFEQRRALDKAQQKSKTAMDEANQAEKEFLKLNEARKLLSKPTISETREVVKARTKSRMLLKEAQEARRAEMLAKESLNLEARRLVRKKGFLRLGRLGALGALGYGAYKLYTGGDNNEEEENGSNYRWTPNNGWQYKDENGNWGDQLEEFGVDRFGNTNFYDADTGQWYSDYIPGSDGSVYDTQGNLLGNVMPQGGNFFDYNALLVAKLLGKNSLSPTEIMDLQRLLGVTPDGLIGARTLNAIAKQSGNPLNYFTIYS